MSRMTKREYTDQRRYIATPKMSRQDVQSILMRAFKRAVVANGTIDPSKGKYRWQWFRDGEQGEVEANTRSEARARVKEALGITKGPVPVGVAIHKVGVVEGRDFPFQVSVNANKSARS